MIGSDFDTPIMYQDLANSYMGPISTPVIPGMIGGINTSYLGGIQLKQQPDRDAVILMNKKDNEGKNNFIKAAKFLGVLFLLGFIPGIVGNIGKSGGIVNYVKNIFKPAP